MRDTHRLVFWVYNQGPVYVTVAQVSEALNMPRSTARRYLDTAYQNGELLRLKTTFWNGMYYAKRCFYTWIPYDQRSQFKQRLATARLMDALRKAEIIY